MPQSEEILWDILEIMTRRVSSWESKFGDSVSRSKVEIECGVHQLKAELVLKYLPADIEDTVYFMKYRGYLSTQGVGVMREISYSLTEKALAVYDEHVLPVEEAHAFKESLWKIEPEYYGIGPNLKAWKKWFLRRKYKKK